MSKSDGKRLLAWLLFPALGAATVVWLVVLVAVAQRPHVSQVLSWGLVSLLLVAVVLAPLAWWQQRLWRRAVDHLAEMCRQLHQGNYRPSHDRPESWPLADLANQLLRLGTELEHRREQDASEQARRQRHQCREVVERLSRAVVREVQQPLAGIAGFVDMALRRPGLDEQLRNYLTLIENEARQSREALERIVRYLDEGSQATEAVDVNTLIAETVRAQAQSLGSESIDVHLNLARQPLQVEGDPARLRFVLSVLLQNAREAMAPEGGNLEMGSRHEGESRVVIYVRDSGRGISPERQPYLFTPFFTEKGSRKGAGLSLCLAERVVRAHGGEMDFWSRPGQGSIFFVYLPALSAVASSVAPSGGDTSASPPGP